MLSQSNQKSKRRSTRGAAKAASASLESRSLAKGLMIVEALASREEAMALKDIAALIGLGKASTLRLLRTLQGLGYIHRDEHENYYCERVWPTMKQQTRLTALRQCAMPVLARLNAELGETVALAFLFDDVIRVVEVIESTHHIRMSNYRGGILQPYASSLGKSITAYQTPELVQRLLYTYGIFALTPNTLTDFRAIQNEFATVQERGYAWDNEETVLGGICCGAPIHGPGGEVFAAISMSMPKARFTKQIEEVLPKMMIDYAAEVAKGLKKALG
ncbi:MAG: IclR family transcriptional regulator [Acidobacteriota bacterium]